MKVLILRVNIYKWRKTIDFSIVVEVTTTQKVHWNHLSKFLNSRIHKNRVYYGFPGVQIVAIHQWCRVFVKTESKEICSNIFFHGGIK